MKRKGLHFEAGVLFALLMLTMALVAWDWMH